MTPFSPGNEALFSAFGENKEKSFQICNGCLLELAIAYAKSQSLETTPS